MMPKAQPKRKYALLHTARQFILSASVVTVFTLYAIHDRRESDVVNIIPSEISSSDNTVSTSFRSSPTATESSGYKDGEFTGSVTDAYYGPVQVSVAIQAGKIASVQFLDYPHDRRTSQRINSQAMPYLQSEAIQAQSANVDVVSGATLTSEAFVESLQTALNQAKS